MSNIKYQISKSDGRKVRITLAVSGVWFVWNLVAVSLVTSKVPNFIYQSYLLSLFFVVYSICVFARSIATKQSCLWVRLPRLASEARRFESLVLILALVFALFVTGRSYWNGVKLFQTTRAQAYNYQSEHEKFYQLGERLRDQGLGTRDLVIVNNPPNDCWERYDILFLTGAESKTLLEMYFAHDLSTERGIEQKYRDIYFIDQSFTVRQIKPEELGEILQANFESIQKDILRIKKDKTSCQWLVPDAILNAE
jgi:hypothetical protein